MKLSVGKFTCFYAETILLSYEGNLMYLYSFMKGIVDSVWLYCMIIVEKLINSVKVAKGRC